MSFIGRLFSFPAWKPFSIWAEIFQEFQTDDVALQTSV